MRKKLITKKIIAVFCALSLMLSQIVFINAAVADKTAPTIIISTPKNNQTRVSLVNNISLKFSENIYKGQYYSKIKLSYASGKIIKFTTNISKNTLIIRHTYGLQYATDYVITIPAKAVKDKSGNQFKKTVKIKFKTIGFISPPPSTTSPITIPTPTPTPTKTPLPSVNPITINGKVQSIEACADFSLVLMEDGTLVGWGDNEFGQLGDGTTVNKSNPVIIMKDVKQVAGGGTNIVMGATNSHLLILKKDNTVWTTGCNDLYLLGDGTSKQKSTPVKIMDDVNMVAASPFYSVALKNDGWISSRSSGPGPIGIASWWLMPY